MSKKVIVLVANDDRLFSQTAAVALRRRGYECAQARSGREALDIVRIARPDLIVLDFMMPAMDGLETARCLKRGAESRDVPLVLLSSTDNRQLETLAIGGDGDFWAARLERPVELDELIDTIERLLAEPTTEDPLREVLDAQHKAALTNAFLQRTHKRIFEIEETLYDGSGERPADARYADMLDHVAELRGSAVSFGFSRIGEIAADAERTLSACIDNGRAPVGEELESLRRAIMSIEAELSACASPADRTRLGETRGALAQAVPAVLLVHDNADYSLEAARTARFHGMCISAIGDIEMATEQMRKRTFAAVVVARAGSAEERHEDISRVRALAPTIPILVVTDGGTADHLGVVAAGADRVVPEHLDPAELARICSDMVATATSGAGSVLVIDRAAESLAQIEAGLTRAACRAVTLTSSECVLETLNVVQPDMLVLGANADPTRTLALIGAIRSSHRWSELPILMLADRPSSALRNKGFAAGADDVIDRQEAAAGLPVRVLPRLERERRKLRRMQEDTSSGAYRRECFVEEASRVILSLRSGAKTNPVFASLRVDLDPVVAQQGRRAADVLMRNVVDRLSCEFNGSRDLVGSLGGNYLGVMQIEKASVVIGERIAECLRGLEGVVFDVTPLALPPLIRAHIGAAPEAGKTTLAAIVAEAIRTMAPGRPTSHGGYDERSGGTTATQRTLGRLLRNKSRKTTAPEPIADRHR